MHWKRKGNGEKECSQDLSVWDPELRLVPRANHQPSTFNLSARARAHADTLSNERVHVCFRARTSRIRPSCHRPGKLSINHDRSSVKCGVANVHLPYHIDVANEYVCVCTFSVRGCKTDWAFERLSHISSLAPSPFLFLCLFVVFSSNQPIWYRDDKVLHYPCHVSSLTPHTPHRSWRATHNPQPSVNDGDVEVPQLALTE